MTGPPNTPPKSFCRSSGFGRPIEVREPVVGVQHVVPEIIEQRAMKVIRSGARHDRDLPAGGASELGSKRRGLNAKLLHGIHRHQAVGSTRSAERGQRSAGGLHQWRVAGDAEIGADPVHGEIVGIRALPIHAELSLVVEAVAVTTTPGVSMINVWKLRPLSGILSTKVRSITVLTVADSVFTSGAPASTVMVSDAEPKRHLEVDFESILDVKDHVRLDQLLEAGLLDFHAIAARRQIRQVVFARAVGRTS